MSSAWEPYWDIVGQSGYNTLSIPVYDSPAHVGTGGNAGKVNMRFHHVENGINSHKLNIDYAWVIKGTQAGGSTDLTGYARYYFGYNDFAGNGTFTTTGTVAAATLTGNVTNTNLTGVLYGNGTAIAAIPTPVVNFVPTTAGTWYNVTYSRYCTLTFSSGAAGTLTNAPIIFTLTGTQIDYETTKTDGSDVIFVDTNNLTLLTQPVAAIWNLYGTSTFTVIVPNLPNTPYTIYCYWGLP